MPHHGFVRVAVGTPRLQVADVAFNVAGLVELAERAEEKGVQVLVLPELALTGYTCGDLFHQPRLLNAAREGLLALANRLAKTYAGIAIVGLPLVVEDQIANAAAVVQQGRIVGIVPKSYLPNYKEFYEARWFAPGARFRPQQVRIGEQEAPFGVDLLFDGRGDHPHLIVGVEICEDLWTPMPPSSRQAIAGATLLTNISASNEVIGKTAYRRQLVVNQSGRCLAAYAYASCGVHESTTDVVFSGHSLIAENGSLLVETARFEREPTLLVQDVDLERMQVERIRTSSFGDSHPPGRPNAGTDDGWRRVAIRVPHAQSTRPLMRAVEAHPFVPRGTQELTERCHDIFFTQVSGLAKRLEHTRTKQIVLGISGGLDSTLALLVGCKTFDHLGLPRPQIVGVTMPGFGTTDRTLRNARDLMNHLRITSKEIDIRQLCLEEMRAIGHRPFGIDLTGLDVSSLTKALRQVPSEKRSDLVFENVQARMRTSLLMNQGFVLGTGDLSELALGWCTYNGDHMSMYNPNVSIPKTLVKFLVRWAAENEFEEPARATLLDIVATLISPELLPASAEGTIVQSTEAVVGPYELNDFFLFHFLRYGASPRKILYLAEQATFDVPYEREEIRTRLRTFLQRFFSQQFKRSCLPDGPKVGTISVSPRGDWRMPSDAVASAWLADLDRD
jgi:NAD+ synthase (glutamine-hydrolysing)